MLRIRVACNPPNGRYADAPFLSAELEVGDQTLPVVFLVDTGADHCIVDATGLRIKTSVLEKGSRQTIGGVGGQWPVRRFIDQASILTLAKDSEDHDVPLRLQVPTLDVQTPYAEFRAGKVHEFLKPIAPTDRRLAGSQPSIRPSPNSVPLLGRDVFRANGLRLDYDPGGDSWILVDHALVQSQAAPLRMGEPSGVPI